VAIGDATGRAEAARQLVSENRERVRNVVSAVSGATARRVAFLEWTEPLFCAGHWVPEMVSAAGGDDPLGQPGADSRRMTWDDVAASSPEMIIVAPCGYGLKDAIAVANRLPRVIDAEIYAVDANAYFARPGPRVAEGMELLAHLFHPERYAWKHEHRPWARIG
jgi:iron complex transport system substrate-binding protein